MNASKSGSKFMPMQEAHTSYICTNAFRFKMPWTKVHRLDNDGNTITHEKSQVHAEDVLKEFRKRNEAIRSNPYVREIHAQLRGLGPLRKQRKATVYPIVR